MTPMTTIPAGTRNVRRVAAVLTAVAATLAVASALHLSGLVAGRGAPYNPDGAGVGEAGVEQLPAHRAAREVGGVQVDVEVRRVAGDLPDQVGVEPADGTGDPGERAGQPGRRGEQG